MNRVVMAEWNSSIHFLTAINTAVCSHSLVPQFPFLHLQISTGFLNPSLHYDNHFILGHTCAQESAQIASPYSQR